MPRILAVLVLAALPLQAAPKIGYGKGDVHPDFHLLKVGGGFGKLSDFRGRKVVLFNFASW